MAKREELKIVAAVKSQSNFDHKEEMESSKVSCPTSGHKNITLIYSSSVNSNQPLFTFTTPRSPETKTFPATILDHPHFGYHGKALKKLRKTKNTPNPINKIMIKQVHQLHIVNTLPALEKDWHVDTKHRWNGLLTWMENVASQLYSSFSTPTTALAETPLQRCHLAQLHCSYMIETGHC
ncbi:hypothetical protein HAX54_030816 [Datura stramonium]|uniref:Uncharacterized protein n=1 Tax=Datura stramonium TaxID=4076 RepID=A0ABS8V8U6_DATST|nr:hypothetical protein [Datura stramonium]